MRLSLLLAILPLALASPTKRVSPAPLLAPDDAQVIADEYIVKFKEGSDLSAFDATVQAIVGNARHVYSNVFKGFAGKLDKATLESLRNHPSASHRNVIAI